MIAKIVGVLVLYGTLWSAGASIICNVVTQIPLYREGKQNSPSGEFYSKAILNQWYDDDGKSCAALRVLKLPTLL